MGGGQSGTYLRLTRASSGPRVSVAKTYRDENETKMNNTMNNTSTCILLLRKASVFGPKCCHTSGFSRTCPHIHFKKFCPAGFSEFGKMSGFLDK